MPIHLPKAQFSYILALASQAKAKVSHFPNIFRFITEKAFAQKKHVKLLKISLSCIISLLLLGMTISQYLQLQNNLQKERKLAQERKNIEKEIKYWGKTVEKYTNYSEIYLKIASLEYRLGNSRTAQNFVDKALAVNPNEEQGRVLGEKISRK